MTDQEIRDLLARSERNRAERGKPILPKRKNAEEREIFSSSGYTVTARDRMPESASFGGSKNERADGSGTEGRPKRQKYGNQRVEIDGLKFDSKHEGSVYEALKLMKQNGEIRAFIRQPSFDLPGKIKYYADFGVIYNDNRVEFWDAKSPATMKNRVYINKKKQVMDLWGIEIIEV